MAALRRARTSGRSRRLLYRPRVGPYPFNIIRYSASLRRRNAGACGQAYLTSAPNARTKLESRVKYPARTFLAESARQIAALWDAIPSAPGQYFAPGYAIQVRQP